jgi:hypothetical protein
MSNNMWGTIKQNKTIAHFTAGRIPRIHNTCASNIKKEQTPFEKLFSYRKLKEKLQFRDILLKTKHHNNITYYFSQLTNVYHEFYGTQRQKYRTLVEQKI